MDKKVIFTTVAALVGTVALTGCFTATGSGTTESSEAQTEATTVPPTTSIYDASKSAEYKSPAASQRDVSWDITVNKLEIKKFITPVGVADDDYAARINPSSGSMRFAELELTLKNTGYDKQSYITYESADIFTELLWDGNSYYPTYITDDPEGYRNDPISSYVDIQAGETATVRIAFEVPKALGESDSPLRYHLVYKDGDGEDGIYIDLR